MGQARRKLELQDDELSDDALALIEHIGEILAEEYVQLMKSDDDKKEESDESSNIRPLLE